MKSAIYVRSAFENEESIRSQIEYCKSLLSPNDEYEIYSDNGYSGHDLNRPAYKKMVRDIRNHKIGKVIVSSSDRVSRSFIQVITLCSFLDEYNVAFFVEERLQNSDLMLAEHFKESFEAMYRAKLRNRKKKTNNIA